ncbi:1-phosphofructokinase family hexose kinase [Cellulomonas sp. URHD0024]|uniref:1-phosphofructokinase family hexose kinase n=1 Tax=Cellulomonas sp. URHD0024 TaxID=1302620 RepID=UPI0004040A88|nr:PfkB family carbohydrate kinase [Cellulomonas sp. URHD0024]
MITAVAISPSLDVTYEVAELAGIHRPSAVHRVAGGKALNAARAAALLGPSVAAVAVLGGGIGAVVADAARADGLDLRVVDGVELTRTCTSIHSRSTGALTEIYERATPVSRTVFDELLGVLAERLAVRPGWCLVSGGFPRSLGDGALCELVGVATRAGVRVAVDSHGPALGALLSGGHAPDLLKVNRLEACAVLGLSDTTPLADVVAALHGRAGGLVVVTDGVAGMRATDGAATRDAVLPGVVGQFPVGSGDSVLGAFVHALDDGSDWEAALRLAVAAGCANALVPGAARFDPATVRALARDVVIRSVA